MEESKRNLENKKEYEQMVEDQKHKYSFGQQSITQPLKLNQPFILYNLEKKEPLRYKDKPIIRCDIELNEILF